MLEPSFRLRNRTCGRPCPNSPRTTITWTCGYGCIAVDAHREIGRLVPLERHLAGCHHCEGIRLRQRPHAGHDDHKSSAKSCWSVAASPLRCASFHVVSSFVTAATSAAWIFGERERNEQDGQHGARILVRTYRLRNSLLSTCRRRTRTARLSRWRREPNHHESRVPTSRTWRAF